MVFAALYAALPAISGAFLAEPISIFPIPFKDLTSSTESFLPAMPMILGLNLGSFLVGMVLPFSAVVGTFVGLLIILIANPLLYHAGILNHWRPGVGAIATINSNRLDFYFSFGLGLTAAIAVIGIWNVAASLLRQKRGLDLSGAPSIRFKNLFHSPRRPRRHLHLDRPAHLPLFHHYHHHHRLPAAEKRPRPRRRRRRHSHAPGSSLSFMALSTPPSSPTSRPAWKD